MATYQISVDQAVRYVQQNMMPGVTYDEAYDFLYADLEKKYEKERRHLEKRIQQNAERLRRIEERMEELRRLYEGDENYKEWVAAGRPS